MPDESNKYIQENSSDSLIRVNTIHPSAENKKGKYILRLKVQIFPYQIFFFVVLFKYICTCYSYFIPIVYRMPIKTIHSLEDSINCHFR